VPILVDGMVVELDITLPGLLPIDLGEAVVPQIFVSMVKP
jgi:hypothetical protein